jgi:hypothetical protein
MFFRTHAPTETLRCDESFFESLGTALPRADILERLLKPEGLYR